MSKSNIKDLSAEFDIFNGDTKSAEKTVQKIAEETKERRTKRKIHTSIRIREKTRDMLLDLAEMEEMSTSEYIDLLIRNEAKRRNAELKEYRENKGNN